MKLPRQAPGLLAALIALSLADTVFGQEPPPRASQSVEAVAADLEDFVPRYMQYQKIPGVSIVLIYD